MAKGFQRGAFQRDAFQQGSDQPSENQGGIGAIRRYRFVATPTPRKPRRDDEIAVILGGFR